MKFLKFSTIFLIVILLLMPLSAFANADNAFAEETTFELDVSSADTADAPGNLLVRVLCTTDKNQLVTTFGSTLVVNTDYFDLVSKSGDIITDKYIQDKEGSPVGADFALYASKIGAKKQVFGGMKGLSLISYNHTTKNMYIFICGMTISGIKLNGKTELAKFYLKSKTDKVPASAIRAMDISEGDGKVCPSRAIYSAEISSTTDGGDIVKNNILNIDSSLIDKSAPEETTSEKQAEETTTKPAPVQPTTAPSDETIDKMSEQEVESNIKKIVDENKNLNLSDKVKSSTAYKTYEKALQNAEKVLADKNATKAEKAEALKELVKAKTELEKEFPEVVSSENSNEVSKAKTSVWIYVAIAVGIAAIVIVLIIIIKKRKTN